MKKRIMATLIIFTMLTSVGAAAYAIGENDITNTDGTITNKVEAQAEEADQSTILDETETEVVEPELTAEKLTETNIVEAQAEEADQSTVLEETEAVESEFAAEELAEDDWVVQNRIIPDVIPEFVQGDMKVYSAEEAHEKYPYEFSYMPTYRDIYYWSPTFLSDLVDRESCRAWFEETVLQDIINNKEPDEMYTVSFVKRFHISKEDFEKCVEELRLRFQKFHKVNGDDISDEAHELHNADIIYTFDNEIINEYYRR